MRSPSRLAAPLLAFLCFACSEHYEVKKDGVVFKTWNEGTGNASFSVPDADPATFRVLKGTFYAKDRHAVFFKGQRLTGATATSFEALDKLYVLI